MLRKYHRILGLDQKDLAEKVNLAIETIDEFTILTSYIPGGKCLASGCADSYSSIGYR